MLQNTYTLTQRIDLALLSINAKMGWVLKAKISETNNKWTTSLNTKDEILKE